MDEHIKANNSDSDMWRTLATVIFLAPTSFTGNSPTNISIFRDEHVIFRSTNNITKLLVQAEDKQKMRTESELPSVFFTIQDPRFDGSTCIYVLEDLAAYEVLEGGRDSTSDYGSDRNVYFGSQNGVYKYERESLSAKKYGPFRDDIIQLQKVNGSDTFYYLTENNKLFKLENHGAVRSKVDAVVCATQFVLDTSNNLYYVECKTQFIVILKQHSLVPIHVNEDFLDIKLIRPAFIMDDCIPLIGDGTLHILHSNGTCEPKDLHIPETPSAFSLDAGLYMVIALDGKIYEYNVMDVLLKSLYGVGPSWPQGLNKMIVTILGLKDMTLTGHAKLRP